MSRFDGDVDSCGLCLMVMFRGVTRRDGFPYSILNGGGVLDAKASLHELTG